MKRENEPPRQDPSEDPRWANVAPEVEISDRSVELAYQTTKGAKISMVVDALVSGEWIPGDPGPKGRKPIFRIGNAWGTSSKVTATRKERLRRAGLEVELGADNPGRPDTPDRVLDLVRSSRRLAWFWRVTTGEDPFHPVAQGGTRVGTYTRDRSSTEYHFALHAARLGETPQDIQDALMSMGGKTAERGDEYFESNILDPVLERLEKLGLEWGGAPREVKVDPNVKPKKFGKDRRQRDVLVAAPEVAIPTETLNGVYQAGRDVFINGQKDGKKRFDALKAISGECIKVGVPEAVVLASLKKAGVEPSEAEEAWYEAYGRAETGDSPPWTGSLVELLGKDAINTTLGRIRREVAVLMGRPADGGGGATMAPLAPVPEPDTGACQDTGTCGHKSHAKPAAPLIDPADRDPTDRDDYVAPPSKKTAKSADRSADPQDEGRSGGGSGPARKPQFFPTTLGQLYFAEAKDYLSRKQKDLFTPGGNTALMDTRDAIATIQTSLATEGGNSFWHVQKVVAETFAFAGLDLELVTRTAMSGTQRFIGLHKAFQEARRALVQWKKGDELPKVASLYSIKSAIGHWPYINLTSAISSDLKKLKAPFEVRHRATLDQPWSAGERDNMKWFLDRATEGKKERIKGPLSFIEDARRCGWLLNRRECPDHGHVSSTGVVCEREVACKYCRSRLYEWIYEWITRVWPHDKYVTFDVPASSDQVIKEIREKLEVDADGKTVDKDVVGQGVDPADEDTKSEHVLLPRATPDEKRFTVSWNPKTKQLDVDKKRTKWRRRSQHKVIDRKLVSNLLDRIKIGFTKSHDFVEFKKVIGTKLGVRAWPTPTGVRVVMPASFFENSSNPAEAPAEKETLEFLTHLNLWQDRSPREVSKEEVLSLILDARRQIGDGFDKLIYALEKERADAEVPDLAKAEETLATYPFLRNGAMRPVKNKASERDLPWFTKEQMREFMRQLTAERRGEEVEEVAPHECPIPVPDGKGGQKACRKVLRVLLDPREGGTVAQNTQGRYYAKEEAFELAEKCGHTFTSVAPTKGAFAPTERMAS